MFKNDTKNGGGGCDDLSFFSLPFPFSPRLLVVVSPFHVSCLCLSKVEAPKVPPIVFWSVRIAAGTLSLEVTRHREGSDLLSFDC